jgi:hypothetical protein
MPTFYDHDDTRTWPQVKASLESLAEDERLHGRLREMCSTVIREVERPAREIVSMCKVDAQWRVHVARRTLDFIRGKEFYDGVNELGEDQGAGPRLDSACRQFKDALSTARELSRALENQLEKEEQLK